MQHHNVQAVKVTFSFIPPNLTSKDRPVRSHLCEEAVVTELGQQIESDQSFPGTLCILAGGLSWFEFVRVQEEWAALQGKANWELRVTVRQAGTSLTGCSLTEPEHEEQSRSGGASQGQPQPNDHQPSPL